MATRIMFTSEDLRDWQTNNEFFELCVGEVEYGPVHPMKLPRPLFKEIPFFKNEFAKGPGLIKVNVPNTSPRLGLVMADYVFNPHIPLKQLINAFIGGCVEEQHMELFRLCCVSQRMGWVVLFNDAIKTFTKSLKDTDRDFNPEWFGLFGHELHTRIRAPSFSRFIINYTFYLAKAVDRSPREYVEYYLMKENDDTTSASPTTPRTIKAPQAFGESESESSTPLVHGQAGRNLMKKAENRALQKAIQEDYDPDEDGDLLEWAKKWKDERAAKQAPAPTLKVPKSGAADSLSGQDPTFKNSSNPSSMLVTNTKPVPTTFAMPIRSAVFSFANTSTTGGMVSTPALPGLLGINSATTSSFRSSGSIPSTTGLHANHLPISPFGSFASSAPATTGRGGFSANAVPTPQLKRKTAPESSDEATGSKKAKQSLDSDAEKDSDDDDSMGGDYDNEPYFENGDGESDEEGEGNL